MKVFISKNPFPNRLMVFDGSIQGKISLDQSLQLIFYDGKITLKIFKSLYIKNIDAYFVVQNLEYFLLKMRSFRNLTYIEVENKEENIENKDPKLDKIFGWKNEFGINKKLYHSILKYQKLEEQFKQKYQKSNCKEHMNEEKTSRRIKSTNHKGEANDCSKDFDESVQCTDPVLNSQEFVGNELKYSQITSDCSENSTNQPNTKHNRPSINLCINNSIDIQNVYKGIEISFRPKIFDSIKSSLSNSCLYLSKDMTCHLIFKNLLEKDMTLEEIEQQIGSDAQNTLKSMMFTKIIERKGEHFTLNNQFKVK